MKKSLKETGITLIALVITIIILLILAGVTIGFAVNGNGLFDKAKQATEKYNNEVQKEETEFTKYSNEIDSYVSGNRETVIIPEEEYNMLKNANSYSEYEKKIGTWMNGKPLYKKSKIIDNVIVGNSLTTIDSTLISSVSDMETLCNCNVTLCPIGTGIYAGKIGIDHHSFCVEFNGSITANQQWTTGDYNCKAYITIEYTKTTDPSPTE